jgi:hypothetical protein
VHTYQVLRILWGMVVVAPSVRTAGVGLKVGPLLVECKFGITKLLRVPHCNVWQNELKLVNYSFDLSQ